MITEDQKYWVVEIFGVFDEATKLEDAIMALQEQGFDRSDIDFMAAVHSVEKKMGRRFKTIRNLEDDAEAPATLYANRHEMAEAETALIGVPIYIGGVAGALIVVAAGGAVAGAVLAAAASGVVGGGIGALFAHNIGERHAKLLEESLKRGGIALVIRIKSRDEEKRAVKILFAYDASYICRHEIERSWGADDIPLSHWNPDPFLING